MRHFLEKVFDRIYSDRKFDLFDYILLAFLLFCLAALTTSPVNAAEPTRADIERSIRLAAITYRIDPHLALAIAEVESKLNPNAVGDLGEIGLFQLRPEFHSGPISNYRVNAMVAMRYLAKLKRTCSSYGEAYFVCFNYGTSRTLKYPRKFPYYKKVMSALAKLRRLNEPHFAQVEP